MATCSFLRDLVGRALGEDGALGHDDDAVGIVEHHIHVVLDDDRRDAFAAHDRGDGVHDLALVAGADTPLVGSSRNSSFGFSA